MKVAMKFQILKLLRSLKILATPCLVFLTFSCQTGLNTSQKIQNVKIVQNRQEMPNTVIQLSQQPSEPKKVVSVKDFGAVGDGIQDDTSAIQKAIDDVHKAGGGVVNFPSGIYKVTIKPNTAHAITIRPQLILQGNSNKKSVIKLASEQGNYSSILAGEKPDSDLSNFAMYDLAIDGNSSNNPVNSESDFNPEKLIMRHAVRIYIGKNINIERCRFTNLNSRNVITVNGNTAPFQVSVSDVLIKNNIFELISGGNVDYDHSTIYTHGKRIQIRNNYFSSKDGAGTKGARTAIETHGDEHTVKENEITGFANGIYVTGYASSSNNLLITDNVIKNAHTGIKIWSYFSDGNTTNPAISNATVANNKISLNIDGWRDLWGNSASVGIGLEPNSDAPIKNLSILNNEISFTNFSGNGREIDNLASGIRMWRYAFPNINNENIRIEGNKITQSLASGIYISMLINKGEISQNNIVNSGQSNGNFHPAYKAGIIIDGVWKDVNLNSNLLEDNQTINTMKEGIISSVICKNICKVSGNKLQVNSNKNLQIFRQTSQQANNNFQISN
ncbi:glycosyl hydrolase family 28-related protein [Fischerella thermalis]|nr:glycosyl hydrolase family 28-related protein [Fischerella thermalis]